MALIHCDFFSDVLRVSTSMTVILPQETSAQIGTADSVRSGDFPTLYLLHGLSDDHTAWLRRTSIERYAAPLGLAVVMPQVHRSFYTDERYGHRYWTFLSEELPEVAESFFRLSRRREDTFVAGLSMGGYGAMKWALRRPGRFAAAASLSGALDVPRLQRRATSDNHRSGGDPAEPDVRPLMARVFGEEPVAGTDNDLMWLLERLAKAAATEGVSIPRLYACCGAEDFIYNHTLAFRDACERQDIPVTCELGPGEHVWSYWDAKIQDVLAWLPLEHRCAA